MKEFFKSYGSIHLLVAIVLLPVQSIIPELGKIVLAPYVFYLVWARNPLFMPALFVLIAPGSTIAYVVLLSTLLVALRNYTFFKNHGLKWLLLLNLLPLPVFMYMTGIRVFTMNTGIVDLLTPLGFYLGLFPFYYGVIVAEKVNKAVIFGILLSLFLLPFFMRLPFIEFVIRAYWISFPLFFAIAGVKLVAGRKFKVPNSWFILSFLFIVVSISYLGVTFTLIFASSVALIATLTSFKAYDWILNIVARPRVIILSVLLVSGVIYGNDKFNISNRQGRIDMEELSYFKYDEFWTLLRYKAFDDRAVIWEGGWNSLTQSERWWPSYEIQGFSYTTNEGARIENVKFGIHNIGLELMRYYGILLGGYIAVLYILMLIFGPGKYLRYTPNSYSLILIAGACLGTGLIGGLVGQYVLQVPFSFILFGVSGILNGIYLLERSTDD